MREMGCVAAVVAIYSKSKRETVAIQSRVCIILPNSLPAALCIFVYSVICRRSSQQKCGPLMNQPILYGCMQILREGILDAASRMRFLQNWQGNGVLFCRKRDIRIFNVFNKFIAET